MRCTALAALLALSCLPAAAQTTSAPPDAPAPAAAEGAPAQAAPAEAASGEAPAPERHRFVLTFEPTERPGMALVRSKLLKEGIVGDVLAAIGTAVTLPQDVPVTFKDCDTVNAFWDPEAKSLTFCYELIEAYNTGYEKVKGQEADFLMGADQDLVLTGTTVFIMLHELGHGLTDMFRVPITGREEDAVDQFATLMLIGGDEPGTPVIERPSRLALLGAYFFKQIASDPAAIDRSVFSDEHALGQQRYYDVMCLVLGSDGEAYAPILTPGLVMVDDAAEKAPDSFDAEKVMDWVNKTDALNILPSARAMRCEDEFKKYEASWEYLTETFMASN